MKLNPLLEAMLAADEFVRCARPALDREVGQGLLLATMRLRAALDRLPPDPFPILPQQDS